MESTTNPDILGEALSDYFYKGKAAPLLLHTSYGTTEDMPVDWFFRDEEDFPLLEFKALHMCKGNVLDIGAGAGSHALYLQDQGLSVTALDASPQAAWIMSERGVRNVRCTAYQNFKEAGFDTILLLMNGIGVIGHLHNLPQFLDHMRQLLQPNGQLLFDSSDITYLYENSVLPLDTYYGEVSFQFEYQSIKGAWFDWLYVDSSTMLKEAIRLGWQGELLYRDEHDQYLMRLTIS